MSATAWFGSDVQQVVTGIVSNAIFWLIRAVAGAAAATLSLRWPLLRKRGIRVTYHPRAPYVMDWNEGGRVVVHSIAVMNPSGSSSVTGVRVEVMNVDGWDTGYVPITLHQKGDEAPQFKESFDLSPGGERFVDVVVDVPAHTQPRVAPDRSLLIWGVPRRVQMLDPSPTRRFQLRITGNGTPPLNVSCEVSRTDPGEITFRLL